MPDKRTPLTALVLASLLTPGCHREQQADTAAPNAPVATADRCAPPASASPLRVIDTTGTGSAVALAELDGTTLAFIADADDEAVHVVDVDSGAKLSTTLLQGQPSQLLLLQDGRLAVAIAEQSQLHIFDTSAPDRPLARGCAVRTATEPVALATTPDGKSLLVSSDWGQTLGIFDAKTLARQHEIALPRSPRAVVVSDDGSKAFVSHAAGGRMSTVDLRKHEVDEISLSSRNDRHLEELRLDSRARGDTPAQIDQQIERMRAVRDESSLTSCQGFALAKTQSIRGRVLAPHVLVDSGDAQSQRTSGYGSEHTITEVPSVAVIDAGRSTALGESLGEPRGWSTRGPSGELLEECILPRSAVVDDDSQTLLVGCLGIDSVVAYDAGSANPADAELHRWRVASGPTGIAVDPKHRRAVVWSQFDRSLGTLDLAALDPEAMDAEPARVVQFDLAADPDRELTIAQRLGRRLFHATQDTRIAGDGRACASCHPAGRDDGLVWSTPNGPRRSIMLAGRVADTAPYGWGGDAVDLERHLDDTFERLGGVGGLRSVELDALMSYVATLAPPPVEPGSDDPLVARGESIFASAQTGCATCHSGPTMSDQRKHDVGSKAGPDRSAEFETPSLRYIAARGPYFHDGRYGSLRELLEQTDGKMGKVGHLDDKGLDALEAYLRSL